MSHEFDFQSAGDRETPTRDLFWCHCGGWSLLADHDEVDYAQRGFVHHVESLQAKTIKADPEPRRNPVTSYYQTDNRGSREGSIELAGGLVRLPYDIPAWIVADILNWIGENR